jgi:CheY-like chemotaxis protein
MTTEATMNERRLAKRVPYKFDVVLNDAILVKGIDISEGGMYVHTGRSIPVGSRVRVKFMIQGRRVELEAEVRSCHESVGMGLNFVNPQPQITDIIKSYVKDATVVALPAKKKVLLVGGAPAARRIIKSRLVQDGYTVLEAADGAEGLKTAGGTEVDLVMLDMSLGDVDWFKALEMFRKEFPGIRVVVISPSGEKAVMEKAFSMGAAGFMTKMLASPVRVAETVKNALSRK